MKKQIFTALMLFLFVTCSLLLSGQTTQIDLTTPIAVDPDIKIGKLDNGLVYYIRYNKKPEKEGRTEACGKCRFNSGE